MAVQVVSGQDAGKAPGSVKTMVWLQTSRRWQLCHWNSFGKFGKIMKDLVPDFGPKTGSYCRVQKLGLACLGFSVCVCLAFCLSLSFSVFLCLSLSFSVFVLQAECIVSRKTLLTRVCVFRPSTSARFVHAMRLPLLFPPCAGFQGRIGVTWKGRRWRFAGRRHTSYKGICGS